MKILLVKTSSLGDVAHTLMAIREAKQQRPELVIDWLVEEGFTAVAQLAQQDGYVAQVIPIAFRQWRKKKPFGILGHSKIRELKTQLKAANYDLVIDAQGLLKSAYLSRLAGVPISGFDRQSAREGLASYAYTNRYAVGKHQHAIHRLRKLFAQALNYRLAEWQMSQVPFNADKQPTILLVHATTWDNKCYPINRWRELVQQLTEQGYRILLPQYNTAEFENASAIAQDFEAVDILPKQTIASLITTMQSVSAVISVDTGLAHLASYLQIPTVALFGPTNPRLTGVLGRNSQNLSGQVACAPCMKRKCYRQGKTRSQQQQAPCMDAINSETIKSVLQQLKVQSHR